MVKKIAGFLLLFACYHTGQYMILSQNNTTVFLLLMVLFLPLAWLIAKWQGFTGLSAWGMTTGKEAWKQTGKGFLAGTMVMGLYFVTCLFLDILKVVSIPPANLFLLQLLVFVAGTFFPSLAEDILTRAYLYHFLKHRFPPYTLLVLSATVYVLNHLERLQDGWVVWVYLFIIGIYLMLALQRTGNIWLTVGLHWSGNIVYQVTNHIMQTDSGKNNFPPMVLYIFFLLLLIPLTYILSRKPVITIAEK